MKKFFLPLCLIALFTVMGCEDTMTTPKEVSVSLDYSFVESGSMTRGDSKAYSEFYDKYLKTKLLTPKNFNLTFTNVDTKAKTEVNGEWSKNHSLKLLTGSYEVTGTSYPSTSVCLDTTHLCFNETITITEETTTINLTAQYDSYMLIFDKGDKIETLYSYLMRGANVSTEKNLKEIDGVYYAFFRSKIGHQNWIVINRPIGYTRIEMDNVPFEKGYYYYFNDLSNSFDLPKMTPGN